jgi:perosamine synthetase
MIPVNEPLIAENSRRYVSDAISSGWISSSGKYIDTFERKFAEFIGIKYATTTTNGTTALHLALATLEIKPGDEVILPDLTIISCALAVYYLGAIPVVVDVEKTTGNINPELIEKAITPKTRAIIPVHLYGHPCRMDELMNIARRHKLFVIEDAAEAHGALYKNRKTGSIGDISAFSFYANKIVTTGEGGMVVTNKIKLFRKAQLLKNLAHSPTKRFVHDRIGYNFRMTNIQAALGLAQLEEVDRYIKIKLYMAKRYTLGLSDIPYLELPVQDAYARSVYWMYAIRVTPDSPIPKQKIMESLKNDYGIDTRDFFYPLSSQPIAVKLNIRRPYPCPVAADLSRRGFYLPSGLAITNDQIDQVVKALHLIFQKNI